MEGPWVGDPQIPTGEIPVFIKPEGYSKLLMKEIGEVWNILVEK